MTRHTRRPEDNGTDAHVTTRPSWRATLAVTLVAIAAAAAGLFNRFTLDDAGLIVGTERLHGLWHWREILTSPYWPPPFAQDLYRPLTSLLLALEYQLGSGAPLLFRVVTVVLYALASIGVLRLAWRLTPGAIALGVALLFAAHPVHAEVTVLAVAQGELIVGLLGVLMVGKYLDLRRGGATRIGAWLGLSAMYVAASLAKEQGLILPALLVAAELLLIESETLRARVRTVWRGYALLGMCGILVLLARAAVMQGTPFLAAPAEALVGVGPAGRALTLLQIVPEWLRLLVWPWHLRADYSPAEFVASAGFGAREAAGLVLLLAAGAAGWAARRRAPVVSFGLAWCAITLFPVSNLLIPTGILLAERTLFLPSIGFLLATGGAVAWLVGREAPARGVRLAVPATLCLLLVLAGTARSAVRQRDYRDQPTLTIASVRDSPRSVRVLQSHAETLFDQGRQAEGTRAYTRAIELGTEPWALRVALARRLRLVRDDEAALEQLRLSLAEKPTRSALAELAAALLAVGNYADAARIAEGIIASEGAPPFMVWLKQVADSALATNAPPGSIRVGILTR